MFSLRNLLKSGPGRKPPETATIQYQLINENQPEKSVTFELNQRSAAFDEFMKRFKQEKDLKIVQLRNGVIRRTYTSENASFRYDLYPFIQVDGLSDKDYQALKIGFVHMQLYDFLAGPTIEDIL